MKIILDKPDIDFEGCEDNIDVFVVVTSCCCGGGGGGVGNGDEPKTIFLFWYSPNVGVVTKTLRPCMVGIYSINKNRELRVKPKKIFLGWSFLFCP